MPTDEAAFARLPLFDLPYMLRACPDTDYQRRMFDLAEATANVLTDERLSVSDLRQRFVSGRAAFRVIMGDLTEEGVSFARKGYQRWLANVDRQKGDRSLAKVEASLRKQVAASRRASA